MGKPAASTTRRNQGLISRSFFASIGALIKNPDMEPRTKCSKCGTEILQTTAKHNRGHCAPCWAKRPSKRITASIQAALFEPFYFATLPFILGWNLLNVVKWRLQFPFETGQLRERLWSIFQNRRDVRLYLRGLVSGYHRPGSYWLPFDPKDLAHHAGLTDGAALRVETISFSELPSRRVPIAHDAISPHPTTKVGPTTRR